MCVCVCVWVCERERERERGGGGGERVSQSNMNFTHYKSHSRSFPKDFPICIKADVVVCVDNFNLLADVLSSLATSG